jgi:hypothetical protein
MYLKCKSKIFFSLHRSLDKVWERFKEVKHYCRPSITLDICKFLICPLFYHFLWYHRSYMYCIYLKLLLQIANFFILFNHILLQIFLKL